VVIRTLECDRRQVMGYSHSRVQENEPRLFFALRECEKVCKTLFALCSRDVVSRRSRDVLTSRLGHGQNPQRLSLRATCLGLGLGPVGLVSGLGPLRLVETFCAGTCRAYSNCI